MAKTAFSTGHASTVTLWSAALFLEAQKQTYFKKFSGPSPNDAIQTKTDLSKEAGDTIKFDLLMNLTGEGVTGDTEIEGNEEQLVYYQDSVVIDLRGTGVRAAGKMSLRRTKHSIRSDAKMALGHWMGQIRDDDMVKALSGQVNYAGQGTAIVPDSARKWPGGGKADDTGHEKVATDSALDADNLMICETIRTVKRKAKLVSPKIRPIMVDGGEHYVLLMHPYQAKALTSSTEWKNSQYYAASRGKSNPLFTGSLGMISGVVLHEYEKIITRLGAATQSEPSEYFDSGDLMASGIYGARALLLGAQAGVYATGQNPGWYEKNFDYDRVPGVATDIVYGIKKARFNSKDFGLVTVDTAYAADS